MRNEQTLDLSSLRNDKDRLDASIRRALASDEKLSLTEIMRHCEDTLRWRLYDEFRSPLLDRLKPSWYEESYFIGLIDKYFDELIRHGASCLLCSTQIFTEDVSEIVFDEFVDTDRNDKAVRSVVFHVLCCACTKKKNPHLISRRLLEKRTEKAELYAASQAFDDFISSFHRPENITHTELKVLRLIGTGKHWREIADDLGMSPFTVRKHKQNISDKIGVPPKLLGVWAMSMELIESPKCLPDSAE